MEETNIKQFELKRFTITFLLMVIGQSFLVLSTVSFASAFKFLPRWMETFVIFTLFAFFIFLIAAFLARNINKYFRYSFYLMVTILICMLIYYICETSTNPIFLSWSKALEWVDDILIFVFYLYFFYSVYVFCKKYEYNVGIKHAKTALVAFIVLYSISTIATFLSSVDGIKHNIIANRIFLYGGWVLNITIYVYTLVVLIIFAVKAKKRIKLENKKEAEKDEKVPQ